MRHNHFLKLTWDIGGAPLRAPLTSFRSQEGGGGGLPGGGGGEMVREYLPTFSMLLLVGKGKSGSLGGFLT